MKKICLSALSFLFLIFNVNSHAALDTVRCDSNTVLAANSCDVCYDGWTQVEGDYIGFFNDDWENESDGLEIMYKEEQVIPQVIPLGWASWGESKASPGVDFWQYTPEFEALYSENYGGYILEAGWSIAWIESSLWSGYSLQSSSVAAGVPVGMIIYDRVSQQVLPNGNFNIMADSHRECVLITSGIPRSDTPPIEESYSVFDVNENAANFLAEKWIIQDHKYSPENYALNSGITRREMLKVMMNLSGKKVPNTCEWKFEDFSSGDWWCKYAEAALTNDFIAANTNFRPDDNVTQAEALKMVMQVRNIKPQYELYGEEVTDWRRAYFLWASSALVDRELIWWAMFEYDAFAKRSFVFTISARSYTE